MSVERLARALGVWMGPWADLDDPVPNPAKGNFSISARNSGECRIAMGTNAGRPPSWDVDEGTALIFLLALASGLRLDVGRCPACEERGGDWEWAYAGCWPYDDRSRLVKSYTDVGWTTTWVPVDDMTRRLVIKRPCPECSEAGLPVACSACDGRGSQRQVINIAGHTIRQGDRVPLTVKLPARLMHMFRQDSESRTFMGDGNDRACGDCHGTGKQPGPPQPTGRRILGAEAILEATPREWVQAACGRRGDDALDYLRGVASRQGAVFVDKPEWVHGTDGQMQVRMRSTGDRPTRDALAVRADELQAEGDPLGELLSAWLAGECKVCASPFGQHSEAMAGWCHGHGTVLGADWPKLEALVEDVCDRLE